MRFFSMLTALLTPTIGTEMRNKYWQDNENLCNKPHGSFEENCEIISLRLSALPKSGAEVCKLWFVCNDENYNLKGGQVYFPLSISYQSVTEDELLEKTSESSAPNDKCLETNKNLQTEPCLIPEGNYKNSCINPVINYLPLDNPTQSCLFSVLCDPNMYKREESRHRRYNASPKYKQNQVWLPLNAQYTNMKNLAGDLIHPSGKLNFTDECIPIPEHQRLLESDAMSTHAGFITVGVVASAMALTL